MSGLRYKIGLPVSLAVRYEVVGRRQLTLSCVNTDMAMEYYDQIRQLGDRIGASELNSNNPNELLAMILKMPEVMDAKKQDIITEENWPIVESCLDQAIKHSADSGKYTGLIFYVNRNNKSFLIFHFAYLTSLFR